MGSQAKTDLRHFTSSFKKIHNFSKERTKIILLILRIFTLKVSSCWGEYADSISYGNCYRSSLDWTDLLFTYLSDPILASGINHVGLEDCLDTMLELFSREMVGAEKEENL